MDDRNARTTCHRHDDGVGFMAGIFWGAVMTIALVLAVIGLCAVLGVASS